MNAAGNGGDAQMASAPQHVFGPVFSRRLGRSLGIDPVPEKTCNWNCVYCQLGRTVPLKSKRQAFFPPHDIIREAESVLSKQAPGTVDWVTFVGSGETLLHADVGWMVDRLKAITDLPVAIITNGALLADPQVRREILAADAVLPSLDAGTAVLFKRINRPHPGIPFLEHVGGLEAFRREYAGQLLLEVMLIRGVNDTEAALSHLAAAIDRIKPDGIHLSRPDRPPAEAWVLPADEEGFMRAASILGSAARVLHPVEKTLSLTDPETALETIVGVLIRHPLSATQLQRALANWTSDEVSAFLATLETSPRVKKTERLGEEFWISTGAVFPSSPSPDHAWPHRETNTAHS